jgi:WD40 repeat protein
VQDIREALSESPTQWTINWGDGNIQTVPGNPSSVTHIFTTATPGTSTFNVSASALVGGTATTVHVGSIDSAVFVQPFGNTGRPRAGYTPMVFGPDGNLYVAEGSVNTTSTPEHNAIYRFDGSTGAPMGTFVAAGYGGLGRPLGLAFGPDGNLYVASNPLDGTTPGSILRYNGVSGVFMDVFVQSGSGGFSVGGGRLAFGPEGLYYTEENAPVLLYDAQTGAFIKEFSPLGGSDLVFGPDGNLYVGGNRIVTRLDASTGAFIDRLVPDGYGLGGVPRIDFGPDGDLYVANRVYGTLTSEVILYDGMTGTLIHKTNVVSGTIQDLVFGPDGRMYVTVVDDNEQISVLRYDGPYTPTSATEVPVNVLKTVTYTNNVKTALTTTQVTSTVTVANGVSVADLSVKLNISASNTQRLAVSLVSPDGTRVPLVARNELARSSSNLTNTVLLDEARTPLNEGAAPYRAAFIPRPAASRSLH